MANDSQRWAYAQNLPAAEKAVLVALAWHENSRTRVICPSYRVLMKDTGYSRPTIWRALQSLKKKGLIDIHPRTKDGNKLASDYALNVKKG